ncbi:MAG: SWIM zinc finger family protein [Pseudonocardiales bacterium]
MRWERRYPPARAGHRPPPATGRGSRRGFGATWWGRAWLEALEQRARLDPNRLSRGRGYARRGTVDALQITPGLVRADVQGSRARPYQVTVRVRELDAAEWDRVLDAVAAELGHTAALVDGELPPAVADDVAATGLDLLPGAGEVQPRCSCPDWADPCKHAAAVCYLVADALDTDPFALLRLRGRDRDEVLAGLRARRRTGLAPAATPGPPAVDEGVPAREAYQRLAAPLPAPPLPPPRPGRPAVLPTDPPPGLSREDLVALAADAAARCLQLADGTGDGGLALDERQDLARRGAALLGRPEFGALATAARVPSRDLASDAIAWRHGGCGGLAVLHDAWQPDADALAEGRAALGGLGVTRVWRNRITCGGVQLRLGQDGQWYRLARSGTGWDLDAAPDPDPAALLAWADARAVTR